MAPMCRTTPAIPATSPSTTPPTSRRAGGRGIDVTRLGSGAVSVTIAAGATVTGGTAGVFVANAATGLQVARKYTSGYAQGETADELVAVTYEGSALRNQLVIVASTVTGGTDAAVHLNGGGVLVLKGGEVRAGSSSGVGILGAAGGPALEPGDQAGSGPARAASRARRRRGRSFAGVAAPGGIMRSFGKRPSIARQVLSRAAARPPGAAR